MCGAECLRFVSTPNVIVEQLPWGPHEWLVKTPLTQSEHLMLVRVTMPPGEAHQFHRHPHFEEALYFLEGRIEQWIGQEKRVMQPGEVAHIPADVVHGSYNIFDQPCVFLAMLASARFQDPMLVDVCRESPWCDLKTPIDYSGKSD
jgi:quercetin dioxygenase-like cupin family protein